MSQFLDAAACRSEIKRMINAGETVRAAVAYWGLGAIEELGIHSSTDLTVVCDVRGGGSNPEEVERLIRLLGKHKVLTHDRLHAKTWIGKVKAIVGSSNASSNGLGREGREVVSLVEANLLVDDQAVLRALDSWLDEEVLQGARKITNDDLKIGAERHGRRRDGRPAPETGDLLSLLRSEPESFADRNFQVWVWDPSPAADWAQAEIRDVQAERDDVSIDFYQDIPDPLPGTYILDFGATIGKGGLVGMYQVLKDRHLHEAKDGSGSLILCRQAERFEGLRIGNKAAWRAAARRAALSDRSEWQIAEFAKLFLV